MSPGVAPSLLFKWRRLMSSCNVGFFTRATSSASLRICRGTIRRTVPNEERGRHHGDCMEGGHQAERMNCPAKVRGRYRKDDDEALAVLIRRLVDERPSYGYRRIAALVNRQRWADGKPRINVKPVLRITQVNHLTLERHTGRRRGRTHDGVVIALRSNVYWCSDHLASLAQPRCCARAVRYRRLRSRDHGLVGHHGWHLR
jgi:HTH-like domain